MKTIFKIVLASLLFINATHTIEAQQDTQFTQYMYNMNIVNPAYAGSKPGTLSIGLMGRTQWVGVPGAPNTATLSVHKPITDRMGLGISLLADKIGPVNEQFLFADYSYTIPVGYFDNLAFGIKAGVSILDASLADLQTVLSGDINFSQNIGKMRPNFGAGLFYYSEKYYVGLSVPNILNAEYLESEGGIVTNISKKNHLFLTGGYVFDLSYDWKFKPSLLAKMTQGTPLSVDVSANFLYDERFELGASYRWGDSVSAIFNAKVGNNLRIGYGYDHTLTRLSKFNSGSHEVFILFDIVTALEVLSPRFF